MRTRRISLCLILLCAMVLPSCGLVYRAQVKEAMFTPRQAEGGRLEIVQGVPVLHLYGTDAQMGRQYGAVMGPALQAFVKYADSMLPRANKTRLLDYAHQAEPHLPETLRAQLRAAAEAADMPYDYMAALNLVPRMMCSTLAVCGPGTADGRLIMGRNAEYFAMGLEDCGSLLVVHHGNGTRLPTVAVSFIGMLGGFATVNSQGLCQANMLVFNALGGQADPEGLPIQLAMRIVSQHSMTAADAAEMLQKMRHSIPMNVMVADSDEAIVLELGRWENAVRFGQDGVSASTNYYLTNTSRVGEISCPRLKSLLKSAAMARGKMTVEDMEKALLVANGRHGLVSNVHAVVFEPAAMRMYVSINRSLAAAGPYHTFDIVELMKQ